MTFRDKRDSKFWMVHIQYSLVLIQLFSSLFIARDFKSQMTAYLQFHQHFVAKRGYLMMHFVKTYPKTSIPSQLFVIAGYCQAKVQVQSQVQKSSPKVKSKVRSLKSWVQDLDFAYCIITTPPPTRDWHEVFHFFGANRIGKHRTISKSVKDSEDLDHLLENRIFTKMLIGNNGRVKLESVPPKHKSCRLLCQVYHSLQMFQQMYHQLY